MRRLVYGLLTAATLLGAMAQGATAPASPLGERGYLGVEIGPDQAGAELLSVKPDSAAEKAGLKEGDIVVSVSGHPVAGVADLVEALGKFEAGESVELGIKRGDQVKIKTVKLGGRPASLETEIPEPPKKPALPARKLREIPGPAAPLEMPAPPAPDRSGGYLGVLIDGSGSGGVLISDVRPGSPAEHGKLKAGDLIVALDGTEVANAEDLKRAIGESKPGEEVQVIVIRDGEKKKRIVKLASFQELSWPEALTAAPHPLAVPKPKKAPKPPAPPQKKAAKEGGRGWLGIYLGAAENEVLVEDTVPGGPAESAGLAAGDRIIAVDGARIEGSEDLFASLDKAGPKTTVAVTVIRGGKPLEFDVKLASAPATVAQAVPLPEKRQAPQVKQAKQTAETKARLAKAKTAKAKQARAKEAKAEQAKAKARAAAAKKAKAQEALAKRAEVRAKKARAAAVAKSKRARPAPPAGRALRIREALGERRHFTVDEDDGARTIIIQIVGGNGGGCCCCCCCKQSKGEEQKTIKIIKLVEVEEEDEVDTD